MQISARFAGFLSVGPFWRHGRKFSQHFKGIFSQAYRQFESPLVRQQICFEPGNGLQKPNFSENFENLGLLTSQFFGKDSLAS
jgi:hypothetical protein